MANRSKKSNPKAQRQERRKHSRFLLRGPAWFEWRMPAGQTGMGLGVTRNVGREGAFIESETAPPVGSAARVELTLSGTSESELEARLCGTGEVRHVERGESGATGFGAWVGFRTEAAGDAS